MKRETCRGECTEKRTLFADDIRSTLGRKVGRSIDLIARSQKRIASESRELSQPARRSLRRAIRGFRRSIGENLETRESRRETMNRREIRRDTTESRIKLVAYFGVIVRIARPLARYLGAGGARGPGDPLYRSLASRCYSCVRVIARRRNARRSATAVRYSVVIRESRCVTARGGARGGRTSPGRREEKEEKRGECERTRSAFLRYYVAGRKLCRAGDRLVAKVHFLESRLASERARARARARALMQQDAGH